MADVLRLTAKPGQTTHVAIAGETGALRWLGDHSLKRSKACLPGVPGSEHHLVCKQLAMESSYQPRRGNLLPCLLREDGGSIGR